MKKHISFILSLILILAMFPACSSEKAISISSLAEYSIVYPEEYLKVSEYRSDIVDELANAIEKVTGSKVKTVSDAEDAEGKLIILASGKKETVFSEKTAKFNSAMDYIIGVDGDNIVLGGLNYYSDMRAVYAFMNDYLGYDDIEDKILEPSKKISGEFISVYEEPDYFIEAATWATSFDQPWQIKDIADCGFNMLLLHYTFCTKDEVINTIKWCTRYGIQILMNIIPSSNMPYSELYSDCPMIYGGYVWDEPWTEEHYKLATQYYNEFIEKYSQYGWKPYMNFGGDSYLQEKTQTSLPEMNVISFDWYIFVANQYNGFRPHIEGCDYLTILQGYQKLAEEKDVPLWQYIQSHSGPDRAFNFSKGLRYQLYLSECFGVDRILYFEYANEKEVLTWMDTSDLVVDTEFKKGSNYEYTKNANNEYILLRNLLKNYDHLGNYTYFTRYEKTIINEEPYYLEPQFYAFFDEYEGFDDVLEEVIRPDGMYDSFFVGAYEAKKGNGNAFVFMNLELPDDALYDGETIELDDNYVYKFSCSNPEELIFCKKDKPIKMKINGSKVTCYRDGVSEVLTPDEDGYYQVLCGNGSCLFFTVE